MAQLVNFGVQKLYYAVLDTDNLTWGTPVSMPGAVSVSLPPEGGLTKFYADNMTYYVKHTNDGYSGELEVAQVTDTMRIALFGWQTDDNGLLVELNDSEHAAVAILFEVLGNEDNKRYVFYNVKFGRPNEDHETTTDTADPQTVSLPLMATPLTKDGFNIIKASIEYSETYATQFNTWYDAVQAPSGLVS